MENLLEVKPEAKNLVLKVDAFETEVVIRNNDDLREISDELKQIKTLYNCLDTERKTATKPLDESKKKIMDWFRSPMERLEKAENTRKQAILAFQREQERIRLEAERKLQAEADKKRQEALQKAEAVREAGKDDKAEKYIEKAAAIVAPILAPTVEKVAGISTKKVWKYRVTDTALIPREYLIVNDKMLGEVARATKGALKVSGVEFYPEETISAGRL
jgi:hypothetical protein